LYLDDSQEILNFGVKSRKSVEKKLVSLLNKIIITTMEQHKPTNDCFDVLERLSKEMRGEIFVSKTLVFTNCRYFYKINKIGLDLII